MPRALSAVAEQALRDLRVFAPMSMSGKTRRGGSLKDIDMAI